LILLWCGIGTAMAIATQSLLVRIVLGLIACAVSWHVITIRTKRREPPPVAQVFDRIAPSWYNYRHHSIFTAELEALAGRWQKGRLLNVGCGHGADFLPFKEGFELHGIDISAGMLHQARRFAAKYRLDVSLVRGDAVCLPYADGSFDHAIAVATYHHIPREADRLMALRELYRVLRPGAEAFITCWHRWQVRFWLKQRDVLVPWRTEEGVFYRYYHLFSFGELERLVKQAGFRLITSHAESRHRSAVRFLCRNVCVLVRKE
ncbi:MAG: class I SAM-dependent methyltransferase, partial [Dehalococcoidales bacterium]|nr:class I SAM-dependent methyltransferase [Dehalococcoidales bacterium]